MKKIVIGFIAILIISSCLYAKKTATPTYSCSAVLPDKLYVPAGQTVMVNAQVDCYFITGFGSTSTPMLFDIPLHDSDIIKLPSFVQDKAMHIEALQYFPKENTAFVLEYQPIKGQLAHVPIQVVIRTESMDPNLAKTAETFNQPTNKDGKLVRIYRRLPSLREKKFKLMHTKVFDTPEKEIADINVLPTGNLQIIEHTPDGTLLLVEEAFGKL